MKKLTQHQLSVLANTPDDELLSTFPGFTRKYLREEKKNLKAKEVPPKSDNKLAVKMVELGITEKDILDLLQTEHKPKPKVIDRRLKGNKFKFGIVSDTHFGSKFEAINELHTFYKKAKDDGVEFMVHAGDIVDGSASMHKGFLYELHALGADDQINHVIKNYPNSLTTYFITGNHDYSHYKQNGTAISTAISKGRPDLIYCGETEGDITINGIIIRLYHGGSGAYAISYPAQKHINNIQGGNKPHILIFGHLHTSYYIPYRNIHSLGAGCFQWQSAWMRSKGLNPVVGGWIVEVEHKDGEIISFNPKFVQFYKEQKDESQE